MKLEITNLVKKYDDKTVLSIDELTIDKPEIVAIAGPNGAGKSTLLELIAGLIPPTSGKVSISPKTSVSMVLQEPVMFDATVESNVAFGLKIKKLEKAEYRKIVNEALDLLEITHLRKQNAKTLSGGEKQRTAIARSLVLNPQVLILDEPTQGLDFVSRNALISLVKKVHEKHDISLIVASHDIDFLLSIATKTLSLFHGKVEHNLYDNFLHGDVIDANTIRINDKVDVAVATDKKGRINALIHPESIVLSSQPLKSSMQNVFSGHINKLVKDGNKVKVWVDIGVEICSIITKKSLDEMGLSVGDDVYLEFKASAVKVY